MITYFKNEYYKVNRCSAAFFEDPGLIWNNSVGKGRFGFLTAATLRQEKADENRV